MAKSKVLSPVHQLSVRDAFDGLTQTEKFYAHHMARAAWHGTRIILRQVSDESIPIFDFILEICGSQLGGWKALLEKFPSDTQELNAFLDYAGSFLSNIGNFSGRGDQKMIPNVSSEFLHKLASISRRATELYRAIEDSLFLKPPFSLGYPSDTTTSAYYPGSSRITKDEISMISHIMEQHKIYPENTRLRKSEKNGQIFNDILQASAETDAEPIILTNDMTDTVVRLIRGDHAEELTKICACLAEATKFAASTRQRTIISKYCESFKSGDLHVYRESQREWIADRAPRVENIFGFVEPYRDPQGIRAEWEALVAIPNAEETELLTKLVKNSKTFIQRLPWAKGTTENDGQGPFEKEAFDPPDFASVHALAYCSSIIFGGINLPNYNDIRQEYGFKNVIVANRMTAESQSTRQCPFVNEAEAESFQKHQYHAFHMWVVIHELLGHGTGKMMMEEPEGEYNFNIDDPPVNPLTEKPIVSWYKPGQTWTGQFEDLATTVDECRCELVGAYLMDDVELLALFGFNEDSAIRANDLTYNFYLLLGYFGLRALSSFNVDSKRWGQAHSRAHFAMLRCLLLEGEGFMKIDHDPKQDRLTVRVDRERIADVGKPVLGTMLLKLHMYRATANVEDCRTYYEDLSRVDGKSLEWRKTVIAKAQPGLNYVHANTFIEGDNVVLREYDATAEGILQSWADRKV